MLAPTGQVARGTRRLALAIAFLVAGLVPAAVFTSGTSTKPARSRASSRSPPGTSTTLVNSTPDLWHLQILRIEDILTRHRSAAPEVWTVLTGRDG